MENEKFQKTVLESFTDLREGQVSLKERFDRSEERTIELFNKLNDKMIEGYQMLADQISSNTQAINSNTEAINRINDRLDKSDKIEKRLNELESEIRELRNKLSQ